MPPEPPLDYELQLTETADSTGYFAAVPKETVPFPEAVAYLRGHVFDDFMHKYILGFVQTWQPDQLLAAFEDLAPDDHVIRALVLEASLLNSDFKSVLERFTPEEIRFLGDHSPLIYIRHSQNPTLQLHRKWITHLGDNIQRLLPLQPPEKIGPVPDLADTPSVDPGPAATTLRSLLQDSGYRAGRFRVDPDAARRTYGRALEKLEGIGVIIGEEMRHTASLSPIALLRKWHFSVSVRHRSLHYGFSGGQTSYGRGLQLASAQAACAMEMVERCSSFACIDGDNLPELSAPHPLLYGSRSNLIQEGHRVVDPQALGLETDYTDQTLAWIKALDSQDSSTYVPLQSVFLFANYDEPSLYTGLGSTGLASGSSQTQARLNAMLEVIERDTDGTTPYDPGRCFTLTSKDPHLAPLLADLCERNIYPWFQDITPEFGIPAYRCLVQGTDDTVYRGTSAHPDGKKAIISALTETPYPYPDGAPTRKAPENLPAVDCETLPCWSTGDIDQDYSLLDSLLRAHGFDPVFVDLTRADLDTPVTRVIIPGMEILADFDSFSRVHPRLFNNYLKAVKRA